MTVCYVQVEKLSDDSLNQIAFLIDIEIEVRQFEELTS